MVEHTPCGHVYAPFSALQTENANVRAQLVAIALLRDIHAALRNAASRRWYELTNGQRVGVALVVRARDGVSVMASA